MSFAQGSWAAFFPMRLACGIKQNHGVIDCILSWEERLQFRNSVRFRKLGSSVKNGFDLSPDPVT